MVTKIDMSKDEISNLMDCVSITKKIIIITKNIDSIKWYLKNMKTGDWEYEADVLDALHKKLLDKFKSY